MEILAEKLSKLLDIGIEKGIELYPILRTQFIVWKATESIMIIAFVFLWISIIAGAWSYVLYISNKKYIDSFHTDDIEVAETSLVIFKQCKKLLLITSIIYGLAQIAQWIFAQDIIFLKGLM